MSIKAILKKNKIIVSIYSKIIKGYNCLLTIISPKLNTKVLYKACFGKPLDLKNPKTLNEKVLKMKLDSFETDPLIRQCADKYAVRKYIEEKGCPEILVPLIATYDTEKEIQWDTLPNAFAMKWNFGCGFNIICEDKAKLNEKSVISQMKKWRKVKYHLHFSEMQYKKVRKKIIVEKYLKPKNARLPEDYKVYCFGGKAEFVMLCVGRDQGHPKFLYFDKDFNFMRNFSRDGMQMPEDFSMEKPAGYDDVFRYAQILSEPFPFVRADFYLIDGKIYFGELTFTPGGGLDARKIPEVDRLFGDMTILPE